MKVTFKFTNEVPEKWMLKKAYRRAFLVFGLLFILIGLLSAGLQIWGTSDSLVYKASAGANSSPYLQILLGSISLYGYFSIKKALKAQKQKEIDSIGQ
ncbi:hypothetical protein [Chitinophaga sp. sic0106]|uniref:hypothetical protein n=1 Tax=Chitinophaga sp. sic0106 TaxID=2854785 RepID=UPI001C477609|nr:hypothetical protein [Chitinophaga sp. sic0106]MBV7529860.1 hypothetical protein [Chitinophaga sp. sic0106]